MIHPVNLGLGVYTTEGHAEVTHRVAQSMKRILKGRQPPRPKSGPIKTDVKDVLTAAQLLMILEIDPAGASTTKSISLGTESTAQTTSFKPLR